jgi:hypothetical protein
MQTPRLASVRMRRWIESRSHLVAKASSFAEVLPSFRQSQNSSDVQTLRRKMANEHPLHLLKGSKLRTLLHLGVRFGSSIP